MSTSNEDNWAMAPWVHNAKHRSIHTTQLGYFRSPVGICEKKIAATGIVHEVAQPDKLKFCITGGTDDPAIELRLCTTVVAHAWRNLVMNPPQGTISMKFHLLPHTTHEAKIPRMQRTVKKFCPMYSGVDFANYERIDNETYDFSLEVSTLSWTESTTGRRAVMIQWESESGTVFNGELGDEVDANHPDQATIRSFMNLRPTQGPVGYEFDRYTVILPWSAPLEYTFRYLLSMPLDKTALWRFATTKNTLLSTIPTDTGRWLSSVTTWTMEGQRPKNFVKPTGGKREPLKKRLDLSGVYEPHPVTIEFASTMAAEYYLKIPYMLDANAAAENLTSSCDGFLRHTYIRASSHVQDAAPEDVVFLANILVDGDEDNQDIIFPVEGNSAVLVWVPPTENQYPVIWSGKVLMDPAQFDAKWNVCILVKMKNFKEDYVFLANRGFRPKFVFSISDDRDITILKFIDRILFGEHTLGINYHNWIRTFLMAKHNNRTLDIVDLGLDENVVTRTAVGLNRSQLRAVYTMQTSPLCFVHGPPGTGKSDVSAKHAIDCAASGQKVVILAQSNLALAEIIDKVVKYCDRFGLADLKESIVWNTADSGEHDDENDAYGVGDALLNAEKDYDLTTEFGFINASIMASNMTHPMHRTAIKNVIMRELNRLRLDVWQNIEHFDDLDEADKSDFLIGTDDETTSMLFDLHVTIEGIKEVSDRRKARQARMPGCGATASHTIQTYKTNKDEQEEAFDMIKVKALKRELATQWQDAMFHFISHNTRILATTFGNLPSLLIRNYGAQHLIVDEVCNAADVSFWGAMARFAPTLKSACGIGDPQQNGPFSAGINHNYLREQLTTNAMSRMDLSGLKPVRLLLQYRMHPDISELPIKHFYHEEDLVTAQKVCVLYDDISTKQRPDRKLVKKWCSEFLGKDIDDTKTSVLVSVEDGVLLKAKGSWSKTNHQNVVVVYDVVQSLRAAGVKSSDIMIIPFYGESVALIGRFLKSQGIKDVDVCSVDGSQGRERMVVIVESSSRCHGDETPGFLRDSSRVNVAMTRAKECRIVIGHVDMCSSNSNMFSKSPGLLMLRDLTKTHREDKQVKSVVIGDRLLRYESVLRPSAYIQVATKLPAMDIYDALR